LAYCLFIRASLPMNPAGSTPFMMVTVTISDEIVREAQNRNLQVTEFVEMLIDKGLGAATERPALNSAIERIRALRSPGSASWR
jgi:hypothetical protein